jgi:hypothetical protein
MSYFATLKSNGRLSEYNGSTIWKHGLSEQDFQLLKSELKDVFLLDLDPRDAFLYYAEWWKNEYAGGRPSKKMIFDSIGGLISTRMDEEQFYKKALDGARRLGVKWIVRNNILYFRTMLMQGGLPLKHISENYGHYLNFLMAVLEEQPETVEDFSFNPEITGLLPLSSQNELIYENCFEIVRSILNEESIYDDLLRSNKAVTTISKQLKEKRKTLQRKSREVKPRNYWVLTRQNGKGAIELRVGLADSYSAEGLENILGFDIDQHEYQFYLNDDLVCVFRRMLNGKYKTNWYGQNSMLWDGSDKAPSVFVISNNERREVCDFIQLIPDLTKPSLWTLYSDDTWRLIKGTGTSHENAFILHPEDLNVNLDSDKLEINGSAVCLTPFEGELKLNSLNQCITFKCGVYSFDWTIMSDRPKWMFRSNMPVVRKAPQILIYDDSGKMLNSKEATFYTKKRGKLADWNKYSSLESLSPGCYDLKIEFNGLTAYDCFYNIGQFNVKYVKQSLRLGRFIIEGTQLDFSLIPSDAYESINENNEYKLVRSTESNKAPQVISCRLKEGSKRSLLFEMDSPLKGIAIVDKEGVIVSESETLRLEELNGLRVLSNQGIDTSVIIQNTLNKDVNIFKKLRSSFQPLISLKDDLLRLFNLADTMNHKNILELVISNDIETKVYKIAGFSLYLDVTQQLDGILNLYGKDFHGTYPELSAIPLNVNITKLDMIPVQKTENGYQIPKVEFTTDFIVIAAGDFAGELMPRYVRTGEFGEMEPRLGRQVRYHDQLLNSSLADDAWKELEKYFDICKNFKIPFSTFDLIRSIRGSSKVVAKAFLLLGQKSTDKEEFVQLIVPKLEQELGFNFHWVSREDWHQAINELLEYSLSQQWVVEMMELGIISENQIFKGVTNLIQDYFQNIGLIEVFSYLNMQKVGGATPITHQQIQSLRAQLGERVLRELPQYTPDTSKNYGVPIDQHRPVKLLLRTPIAVAESIAGIKKAESIWSCDDFVDNLRRNMQYAQYLNPEFYKQLLIHTLQQN